MRIIKVGSVDITVCDCHYELVNQYKWYMAERYAARQVKTDKGWRVQFMHRLIANTSSGFDTDHINMNPKDNQCKNLRQIGRHLNKMNAPVYKNNTSGYKGVSKHLQKYGHRWKAAIGSGERKVYIGLFDTAEEAADAYNQVAVANYGEYAFINDIY